MNLTEHMLSIRNGFHKERILSIEELFEKFSEVGAISILQFDHSKKFRCRITMDVHLVGVSFEITSETNHKTVLSAMTECYERMNIALNRGGRKQIMS